MPGFLIWKMVVRLLFMKVNDQIVSNNKTDTKRITQGCIAIDEKNHLPILPVVDTSWLARPENFDDVLVTGPVLMANGQLMIQDELANDKRHPRTCVCTTRNGNLILITVDGRNEQAEGMTLFELAQFTQAMKCRDAINLDGGGSTTMWILDRGIINHPSDNKKFDALGERKVANAILIH